MQLLNIYLFSLLFYYGSSSLVSTKKICKDCKYFIGDTIECRKFGTTNLVTGKVTYNSAIKARNDQKMCGEDATYFEDNHFKLVTVPYYFLKYNRILVFPSLLFFLYFYLLLKLDK
jgi:hypothetical protein